MELALSKSIVREEPLRAHGVRTIADFSDSEGAISQQAHLDPGLAQQLASAVNGYVRVLQARGINIVIHCIPGY
jgi:hypothetical protein